MLQRSSSRPGITLVEVLAAIFIMGVGLLALLVLFPLGALSMARAVRDDRAAVIAANAAAMATAMDLRNDPNLVGGPSFLLTNQFNPGGTFAQPSPIGPGYPVLVDPTYVNLGSNVLGAVAGQTPGIQRAAPSYTTNATQIARWFTFQDEITFETWGPPRGGASVQRPGTYTWTYLLRRPKSSLPDLVEMSVLVYATRAVEVADGEAVFNIASPGTFGTAGNTSLTFTYTAGAKPNIRRGTWILDTTYNKSATGFGSVNGLAYRVETVNDTGLNTLTLEVDPPLKADINTLVVLENVITVLNRSTTWKP